MTQLKNRLLTVGVLLIGAAALGRVALSWVQYTEDSKLRQKQEQYRENQESLRQNEIATHQYLIAQCHAQALKNMQAYVESNQKELNLLGNIDTLNAVKGGPGNHVSELMQAGYEQYYQGCLREHGLEP